MTMLSHSSGALRATKVLVEPLDDVSALQDRLSVSHKAGHLGLSGQLLEPVLCALGIVDLQERDPLLQSALFDKVAHAGRVGAGPFVNEFELQDHILSGLSLEGTAPATEQRGDTDNEG